MSFDDETRDLRHISHICKNFDDPDIPYIIEAMKRGLMRDWCELDEDEMKENEELQVYENLILEISTPLFWKKLNLLLNLNYDY